MRFPTDLDRLQSDMQMRILANDYTIQLREWSRDA